MKKNYFYKTLIILTFPIFIGQVLYAQSIGTAVRHDKIQSTDSTITTARMNRNGTQSTCAVPKSCPGTVGDIGVHYRSYYFTNKSSTSECITVRTVVDCASQIFTAAFLGSFDRTNVCTNYLADPGASALNGSADTMSFYVPAGAQYCIVVSAILMADTCNSFTLYVDQGTTLINGSITTNDSSQTERLFRDGIKPSCDTPKTLCTNVPYAGSRKHDAYIYQNTTGADICVKVTFYYGCTQNGPLFSAAYINKFDSSNLCTGLVADAGSSILIDSGSYSFSVNKDSTYIILIYNQNDTVYCSDYGLKIEVISTLTNIPSQTTDNTGFSFYPNPANTMITIETAQTAKESVMSILNMNGQELLKQQIKDISTQIDVSKLSSGIYFVKLITGNTVEVKKMIKE